MRWSIWCRESCDLPWNWDPLVLKRWSVIIYSSLMLFIRYQQVLSWFVCQFAHIYSLFDHAFGRPKMLTFKKWGFWPSFWEKISDSEVVCQKVKIVTFPKSTFQYNTFKKLGQTLYIAQKCFLNLLAKYKLFLTKITFLESTFLNKLILEAPPNRLLESAFNLLK